MRHMSPKANLSYLPMSPTTNLTVRTTMKYEYTFRLKFTS